MRQESRPDGNGSPNDPNGHGPEAVHGSNGSEHTTADADLDNPQSAIRNPQSPDPQWAEPTLPPREDARALTVVGLGGSAGSIPALEAFFQGTPAETGSAYVVILHLSPEHESRLAQLLSRSTTLPVQQVTGPLKVERGHVYVIPPGKHLEVEDGLLRLRDLETEPGTRVAVDTFFAALAGAHGPQAAAVVLSGTGADGTLGLRQVKEMGGLAVAQSPGEAEYDSMPRHAIASGLVDFVLPAGTMARQIETYWETSRRMRLPEEAAPSPEQREEGPEAETALREILAHVQVQTGHDFARYKRATVLRRIGRRMQVSTLEALPDYLAFLRLHPAEMGPLVGDLLISVTQFFRDPPAWEALERDVLPRLFRNLATEEDPVRAWVCGCATGEEAYSVAILLLEEAARQERRSRLQIFATDMDADAVAQAREGIYPETIRAHVSEERLRRWFYRHSSGAYQIRKEVRECVLFASHDVLRDTPFSRLDLVTCRNLLIYLNREAQEQLFETFHFALRADGYLMLGPSEAVEGISSLFSPTNKQQRLYVRRPVARATLPPLARPAAPGDDPAPNEHPARRAAGTAASGLPIVAVIGAAPAGATRRPAGAGELHRSLLELYAPPSVLIGPEHELVHLSDHAGRFLRVAGGEPTRNLLQLVHPDLRIDLRTALYAAASEGVSQTRLAPAVALVEGGAPAPVRLTVRPVVAPEGARGYFLVLFEELPAAAEAPVDRDPAPAGTAAPAAPTDLAEVVRQLEEQNAALERQLRSTIEQYEAMTEELKASNEELQAMNEEQRSAAEELETSKEELQSLNEELSTVNHELRARVDEVSRANSDLQNFLAATDIGTIFLDRALHIKRYTPAAEALFHFIATDVGRPLIHLTSRLDYPQLQQDAEQVLSRLTPVEREIAGMDGQRHFLARLLPYRSLDDRIEGVVVNFIDITARNRAERARHASEERLRLIIESARDYAIFTLDPERRVNNWSSGAKAMFGYAEPEIIGDPGDLLFVPEDRAAGVPAWEVDTALKEGRAENERWHLRQDGSRFYGSGLTRPLRDPDGNAIGFVKVMRDLTEQKRAEEVRAFLASIVESSQDAILTADFDRVITSWNRAAADLYGYPPEEAAGKQLTMLTLSEDLQEVLRDIDRIKHSLEVRIFDSVQVHKSGREMSLEVVLSPVKSAAGQPIGVSIIARDVTDRRRIEEAVRESEKGFRTLADAVPQLIWTNTPDGTADYFNRRWYEYSGLTYEESAGPGWQAIVHPEDAPASVERWQRALAAGEVFDTEYRLRRADGAYRWHLGRNVPLRDEAGRVTGWFGSATDIEDVKQAQGAQQETQERFRLLVEGARDYAMFLLDAENRITYWSAGAERVFGWTGAEAVGQTADFLFTPEDRQGGEPEHEVRTALAQGRAEDRRWHVRKDGSRFWADGLLMRLDGEGGQVRGFAKVTRDATPQKQAEEALREALEAVARANQELEQRVEERTAELAQVSELRQELLRQLVTAQEEERGRISRDLHDDAGQQVTALLLSLDRLGKSPAVAGDPAARDAVTQLETLAGEVAEKSHRLAVTLRPTALDDLGLEAALRQYVQEWSRWSGVTVEVEAVGLESRLPPEIETTVYRVMQEALTNVLRHAAPREGKLGATRVSLLVQRRADQVLAVVEDDGPGFDAETALSLPPGRRRLGIFGMQERARLAGGTLSIESEPGHGTTVNLRLPLPAEGAADG